MIDSIKFKVSLVDQLNIESGKINGRIGENVFNWYFEFMRRVHFAFDLVNMDAFPFSNVTLQLEDKSSSLGIAFLFVGESEDAFDLSWQSGSEFHFEFVDTFGLNSDTVTFFNKVRGTIILHPIVNGSIGIVDQFYTLLHFFH